MESDAPVPSTSGARQKTFSAKKSRKRKFFSDLDIESELHRLDLLNLDRDSDYQKSDSELVHEMEVECWIRI